MNDFLEKIYNNKQIILESILQKFQSQNLQIKIGIELEFYLQDQNLPAGKNQVLEFINELKSEIPKHNIDLLGIEPEQGEGQIEIKTLPYFDILKLCEHVNQIKEIARNLSSDLKINFSANPYENDCGNSLQINFSLVKNNQFLFAKNNNQESNYLLWSIAGALENTKQMLIAFAPDSTDYSRFGINFNRNLHKIKKYPSPVNISWGYDNRSALIRIPAARNDSDRRLEYRLGSSDADIYLMCSCFLLAVLEGIENQKNPIAEIYGNAFDEQYFDDQYKLELLPNYIDAEKFFLNSDLFNKLFLILQQSKLD